MKDVKSFLNHKAYNLRKWSIIQTSEAGSGHPTTCLSAADLAAALFFYAMRYNPLDFDNPDNDRFILSKGHASPLYYAIWHEAGVLSDQDLLTYRNFDSPLEGHPTFRFSHTEAATGSLGIGLSIGAGMAKSAKMDNRDYRTYVLMGDSELAEGSVWEAVQVAAYYKLDNVIGLLDANRLGQSTETMYGHNLDRYAQMFNAFGWQTFIIDGHDMGAIMDALDKAHKVKGQPSIILAKTIKGYGVSEVEGKQGFHGKAFNKEKRDAILKELEKRFPEAASYKDGSDWKPTLPDKHIPLTTCPTITLPDPEFKQGDTIATRKIYGKALAALGGECKNVVVLDAEVKNSTFAQTFEEVYPDRFVQCFIAEQNMVGMGVGFDRRDKMPFISTFGAFFTRAHDQIRMAAIGQATLRLVGSHCGVSIGEDGPSQMALEDIAMMRGLPGSIVLYPSDAVSTWRLVEKMARYNDGISYLRTTRSDTAILYDNNEEFEVGGCKVVKQSGRDKICVIGAGITLHEALKAYDQLVLQDKEVFISVIDLYSIKPFDIETIMKVARKSGNKIITVEDHYPEGGIGEMIAGALCNTEIYVESLAVNKLPRSGKPDQLMAYEGIDSAAIVKKVKELL